MVTPRLLAAGLDHTSRRSVHKAGRRLVLQAEGLAAFRGERLVFRDLDFAVAAGGALVLTGPNGSGKSTLLRLLAGLLRPAGGDAVVGRRRMRWPICPRMRGGSPYVGHQDAVKPGLTAAENLRFAARLGGGACRRGAGGARAGGAGRSAGAHAVGGAAAAAGAGAAGAVGTRRSGCWTSRRLGWTRGRWSGSAPCWRRIARAAGWSWRRRTCRCRCRRHGTALR